MGSTQIKSITALLTAFLCGACGGGPRVIASTPVPQGKPESTAIEAPASAMPVLFEQIQWLPGMYGGKTGEMLASAIADQDTVMLVLGRGLGSPESEEEIFSMIKAASPETQVVARATSTLDVLMEERGEIPYRTTLEPGGTDVLGRPFLLPVDHFIQTTWLSKKQAMKGADALVTVQKVTLDERQARRLRSATRGGCKDLLANLANAKNKAEAYFENYRKNLDKALDTHFAYHLAAAVPFWKEEISAARSTTDPGTEKGRCLDSFESFIARYETCQPDRCDEGPFLFMGGELGPVIGIDDSPTLTIPDGCNQIEGLRDYSAEVRELAGRAAMDAVTSAAESWNSELARFAELSTLTAGMRDVCAVSHRRVSREDLASSQADLDGFMTSLSTNEMSGTWISAGGKDRVVGLGPITVVARASNQRAGDPTGASALIEKMRGMDKCKGAGDRVLQVSLIDVGSSTVVFMGLFFEAQLVCDGMAPSQP